MVFLSQSVLPPSFMQPTGGLNLRTRFTLLAGCFTLILAGYYICSPLIAAHKLREAVRAADTAAIQTMIDWPSFRASVRRTIAHNAKLIPVAEGVARRDRPTMWQRVRSLFGHSMLDRFVERYITPDGLPKLYHAKSRWYARSERARSRELTAPDARGQEMPLASIVPISVQTLWRRIKRAEFKSPFRFVLEMEDRHKPNRLIESTFQLTNISLHGLDWKLTDVAIRRIDPRKAYLARLNGF